jgi:hypothetical protein
LIEENVRRMWERGKYGNKKIEKYKNKNWAGLSGDREGTTPPISRGASFPVPSA